MPAIAPQIFDDLEIAHDADEQTIRAIVEANENDQTMPPLSIEGREALIGRLIQRECGEVSILVPHYDVHEWRYVSIYHEGVTAAEFLFCPRNGFENAHASPTNGETLILDAWISGQKKVAEFVNLVIFRSQPAVVGIEQMSALHSALKCGTPRNSLKIDGFADQKTQLSLFAISRFVKNSSYAKLLQEASHEDIPRWRFLQFYRIFEQGYLDIILEKLTNAFRTSPKDALDTAQNAIETEFQQLKNLIQSAQLESKFEQIADVIDQKKDDAANPNRFAHALDRRVQRNKPSNKAERGAALVYAIRNSVAHAGTRDIFFEQFNDADVLTRSILPIVEAAIFEFVGISGN